MADLLNMNYIYDAFSVDVGEQGELAGDSP